MNIISRSAAIAAALALTAAPAFAAETPEQKLAAPGQYCKGESKKKAEGQERSDFSTCVRAQAKLRSDKTDSPRVACQGASKKRVKGEKGTAFSRCVTAGAKLLRDQREQETETETETPATA
jgi:hypothetical protein